MKDKKTEELKAAYMRVQSLDDLARSAIYSSQRNIKAIKTSGRYRLFSEGEHAGCRMVYYFDADSISRYLVYRTDDRQSEIAEMREGISIHHDDYKSYKFPIAVISSDPYTPAKSKDYASIKSVEISDHAAIVRSLVNGMGESEIPPKAYAFKHGKEQVIGSFEIFDENKVFAYAKSGSSGSFPAISYDYVTDGVAPASTLWEPSKVYIRVINLAAPFPFLKTK